jgi:hypothetical protein
MEAGLAALRSTSWLLNVIFPQRRNNLGRDRFYQPRIIPGDGFSYGQSAANIPIIE